MRLIYLIIGFFITGLGYCWGCFTLVAYNTFSFTVYCLLFKKFQAFRRLVVSYQALSTYVADFRETKSIARERKKKIIVSIYILMGISIYFAPLLPVKIGLGALTIFITYYLFKVIPDKE